MTKSVPQPPFDVVAKWSWSGIEEDDLGFIEGQVIEVHDVGSGAEDWWHGRLKRNNMSGMFPSTYVEILGATEAPATRSSRQATPVTTPVTTPIKQHRPSLEQARVYAHDPQLQMDPPYGRKQLHSSTTASEDDLEFSFQSSTKYYAYQPRRHQHGPAQAGAPPGSTVPYSHSVPNLNRESLSRESRAQLQTASFRPPPPPNHLVPPHSHSELNLHHYEQSFASSGNNSDSTNVFSYSNGSYFTNSQNSYMSDFSATSAGSFARHKYEQDLKQHELKTSASGNNLLIQDKRTVIKNPLNSSSATGIFKKLFNAKDAPPLPSIETLNLNSGTSGDEMGLDESSSKVNSWIELKIDLNRANSISSKERQLREKRVRENEGYIIFEPHKQISIINKNEVLNSVKKLIDFEAFDLKHVDNFIKNNLKDFTKSIKPQLAIINQLESRFQSKIEYYRALFMICVEHFEINNTEKSSNDPLSDSEIIRLFQTRNCNAFEIAVLFKNLCDLIGLQCEFIIGSLKTPRAISRHYWNSVLINGEYRIIDCALGNLSNPIYHILETFQIDSNESFYFLSEPLQLIYTHIPDKYEDQHIIPAIDPMVALALPPCFPSFFRNGLQLVKFNNALTRLKDFEIFETDLKIPNDIEVNCVVKAGDVVKAGLAQIYWKKGERFVKIKGILPEGYSTGFINIYSGLNGVQKSLQNVHPLSMVIPITHHGSFKELEFVTRYPSIHALNHDLYIKQPQNKNLSLGSEYVFNVLQHPTKNIQISQDSVITTQKRFKIIIYTPSGSSIKMSLRKDSVSNTGTNLWELTHKCNERGVYRGMVSTDTGNSLCAFAEWVCN